MEKYKKSLLFFLLIALSSIITTTPIIHAIDDSGGVDGGISAMSNLLLGYNIAVPDTGSYAQLKSGLETLGAQVSLIPLASITPGLLHGYGALWIASSGVGPVDVAGKSDEVLAYVSGGGGLIVTQPNEAITPQCLPYQWQIVSSQWEGYPSAPPANAAVIADPNHPLTIGLALSDMPDCFDDVGTVDPRWTILAYAQNGDPSFACTVYGQGRVIVELDSPYRGGDVTGDNPNLSDAMVERMVEWVSGLKRQEPVGGELQIQNITVAVIAPYLIASVIAVGALTLLKKRKRVL